MLPKVRNREQAQAALAQARRDLAAALVTHGPDAPRTRLAALRVSDLHDCCTTKP